MKPILVRSPRRPVLRSNASRESESTPSAQSTRAIGQTIAITLAMVPRGRVVRSEPGRPNLPRPGAQARTARKQGLKLRKKKKMFFFHVPVIIKLAVRLASEGLTPSYVRRRGCASRRWQILIVASACARAPAHVCTIVHRRFVLKLQACDKIVVFIQYIHTCRHTYMCSEGPRV